MEYLKKYGISNREIKELHDIYNDGIINFLTEEEEYVKQTIEYLKNKNFLIFPILKNNIKIFLETRNVVENKVKNMEQIGYSNKAIQMVLIDEKLYNNY